MESKNDFLLWLRDKLVERIQIAEKEEVFWWERALSEWQGKEADALEQSTCLPWGDITGRR
jgi:hypothetical protein